MGIQMSDEKIINKLKSILNKSNSVELMVHPGYPSKNSIGGCDANGCPDGFSCSNDRLHELQQLQSELLKRFFNENNIKLINFLDLLTL